jgi:hypothetical protein
MCCRVWGFHGSVAEESGVVGMALCNWGGGVVPDVSEECRKALAE